MQVTINPTLAGDVCPDTTIHFDVEITDTSPSSGGALQLVVEQTSDRDVEDWAWWPREVVFGNIDQTITLLMTVPENARGFYSFRVTGQAAGFVDGSWSRGEPASGGFWVFVGCSIPDDVLVKLRTAHEHAL